VLGPQQAIYSHLANLYFHLPRYPHRFIFGCEPVRIPYTRTTIQPDSVNLLLTVNLKKSPPKITLWCDD
jgi:hypothetical protein